MAKNKDIIEYGKGIGFEHIYYGGKELTFDFPLTSATAVLRKRQPKDYPRTMLLDRRYKSTRDFLEMIKPKK